jgi:hypothetical protein
MEGQCKNLRCQPQKGNSALCPKGLQFTNNQWVYTRTQASRNPNTLLSQETPSKTPAKLSPGIGPQRPWITLVFSGAISVLIVMLVGKQVHLV